MNGTQWRIVLRDPATKKTTAFLCSDHTTVLEAARTAGIVLQAACERGGCGACRALVVDGAIHHAGPVTDKAQTHPSTGRKECVLLCRAIPQGPATIEPLASWTLTRIKPLSELLRESA